MNPTEAAELLGHAAAFDNRNPSAAAAVAWAAALEDVPLDADAKAAVALYYRTPPQNPNDRLWILPHHIRTLRTKIRSARLENFQYEPIADETVPEYLARLRGQTQAIASGRVAAPSGQLAPGKGEPPRELMAGLSDLGWQGNRTVDGDEAELLDTVRRSGPLGVECPACQAAIGKPCKTPGGTEKQPLGKPRANPHSARLRAASGEPETSAEDRAAEERRIRQMSARHLAREAEEIADAVIVDEEAAS
ncbi:hypothetical protein ACFWD7_06100 [Streptomyces mirabilis]|uniref:zinc finger domain-containing protein n=1 Tax=Streptomyces mirabilis TaxID=68239 RepID=UPI0036842EAD